MHIRSKIKTFLFILLACSIVLSTKAQIPVGHWRDHFPYFNAKSIMPAGQKVYCATEFALFSYDNDDHSIQKWSKVQGLSGSKISFADYNPNTNTILVAYQDASIDIISSEHILRLTDIQRAQIPGNRTIHNVLFINQLAYLACDFGVVVLDLSRMEFKDTYYIGPNGDPAHVFDLAFRQSKIYAATERGVLEADINDPLLVDYTHWRLLTGLPGTSNQVNLLANFNNQLIINKTATTNQVDSIWIHDGLEWIYFTSTGGINYSIETGETGFQISGNNSLLIYDNQLNPVTELTDYGWGMINPYQARFDPEGTLWIADHSGGIIRSPDLVSFESLVPNGPLTLGAFSMYFDHQKLLVVGGGLTEIWGNRFKNGEYSEFNEAIWTTGISYAYPDIVNIISHPADPDQIHATTWNSGLLEIQGLEITNVYNENNSSLQVNLSDPLAIKTFGLVYDDYRNLWVTNSGVNNPVSVKTAGGQWKSFHFNGMLNQSVVGPIIETQRGDFWTVLPRNSQIFAFNINQTIEDDSDNHYRLLTVKDESGKTFNGINCITEDLDGNIWIGTSGGPLIYYNPQDVFDEHIEAQHIKIPRNDGSGLADYLLSTEDVTAIAIDGANRKWIATKKSGVFLVSEDGHNEIYSFHSGNSPLPSDWVSSIAIDPRSGEVYFGTEDGVVSFRSTATSGADEMQDVYAFPNPVREDYEGPITITGLIKNATVKITNISGFLVYETESLGGQAIWDGKNIHGERVKTGVYLVFITNDDGSQTFITKILFIN